MKKIDKNSQNRQGDNTLLYFFLFFIAAVLIGVAVWYWIDSDADKNPMGESTINYEVELGKREITPTAKEVSKLLSDNRGREKTIRRLLESKHRRESLPADEKKKIEEELNNKTSINKLVAEIDLRILDGEGLANIYSQLYEQGKILVELKRRACDRVSYEDAKTQLEVTQENWEISSEELEEIGKNMNKWITGWYNQYMKGKKMEEYIVLKWWDGKKIEKPSPDVLATLKKVHDYDIEGGGKGRVDLSRPPEIKFNGYDGFVTEKENEDSREGKTTFGLTISGPATGIHGMEGSPDYHEFSFIKNNYRSIVIKLKKELFFNREGYDEWINEVKEDDKGYSRYFYDISFGQAVETIAHELAHAAVNSLEVDYEGEEKGGHGRLFYEHMEQIEEMMRNSPEFSEFETWWRKKLDEEN